MATSTTKPLYSVVTPCTTCVHKSVCKYRDTVEEYERKYRTNSTTLSTVIQLQIGCSERLVNVTGS